MINIHRLIKATYAEGPGKRVSVWFQGCSRHCRECFAKDTWSFETKTLCTVEQIVDLFKNDSQLEGITILGGEPFEQPQELLELLIGIKEIGKSTIVSTGFSIEMLECSENPACREVLKYVDVLLDGEYVQEMRSLDVPMVGSLNQRFHFLSDRYTMEDFGSNKIEAIIKSDGSIAFNGMGDFEIIANAIRRKKDEI